MAKVKDFDFRLTAEEEGELIGEIRELYRILAPDFNGEESTETTGSKGDIAGVVHKFVVP